MTLGRRTEEEHFWMFVRPERAPGCWRWMGAQDRGYGQFRGHGAHRYSWTLHNGPIPKGLYVCHRCDEPSCVNPDHLFLGTHAENMADMAAKGRSLAGKPAPPRGRLSDADVLEIIDLWTGSVANQAELARTYGVSPAAICRVVAGNRRRHLLSVVPKVPRKKSVQGPMRDVMARSAAYIILSCGHQLDGIGRHHVRRAHCPVCLEREERAA